MSAAVTFQQYTVHATPEAQEAGAVALAVASLPESFGPAAGNNQARRPRHLRTARLDCTRQRKPSLPEPAA